MDISKLMELAKKHSNIPSDLQLTKELGVSHGVCHHWKHGRSLPKPEQLAKLAVLAGLDPAPLVAELLEKTAKDEEVRSVYARFKKAVAALIPLGIIVPLQIVENVRNCILCKIAEIQEHRLKVDF